MPPTAPPLSDEQVRAYQDQGYTIVPGLYSRDEVATLKAESKRLFDPGGNPGHSSGVKVLMPSQQSAPIREALCRDTVTAMLNQLIGPHVEFLSVKPVYKNKATSFGTPWHQDWHYWRGTTKVSLWIALDRATADNGCLIFIPGTHRWTFENHEVESEQGFPNRLDASDLEGLPRETIAVEPGDAVFFHDQLVHGSHPNPEGEDRWSLIATYRDASMADDSPVWKEPIVLSGESVNA